MTNNDGGVAFPHFIQIELEDKTKDFRPAPGMSLREWYAGQALAGFVSAAAFNQRAENMMKEAGLDPKKDVEKFVAMLAHDIAQAMVDEAAKRERGDR